MTEILTMAEIEERYPDLWVLIDDPQTDEQMHVLSGRVVLASKFKPHIYAKAIELKLKRGAIRYTGQFPKGVWVL